MRVVAVLMGSLCSLAMGCQKDPELPPPPIGGTGTPVVPPMGDGSTSPDNPPELDASATAESTGSTSDGSSGSSGGAQILLSGRLLDGPAMTVPTSCLVRLHNLDSLDPGSGIPVEVDAEISTDVTALPHSYEVVDMAGFMLGAGDQAYVSVLCDVDGDGVADNLGAYYPQIPLEPVLLPAQDIDLTLDIVL